MIDLLSLLQRFLLRIHQGRRLTLDECPLSHQGGMGHPDEHILIARVSVCPANKQGMKPEASATSLGSGGSVCVCWGVGICL